VLGRHLSEGDLSAVRDSWQVVAKNNDMLGNLVLDMLSLAREAKVHLFPADVNDLAEQICRLVADRAAEGGIEVIFEPASGMDEVPADPTQLYRCLLNLVSNAVEACGQGGRVRVRVVLNRRRGRFTISVADNGEGISSDNRKKLFTDFFTTKGSRGTGLGLPVTKKLITAMGGAITFHSVFGRGTKFVMALPAGEVKTKDKENDS
jgi:signal transduction histidine kinase